MRKVLEENTPYPESLPLKVCPLNTEYTLQISKYKGISEEFNSWDECDCKVDRNCIHSVFTKHLTASRFPVCLDVHSRGFIKVATGSLHSSV